MELITGHSPRVAVVGYGRWGKFCHAALIRTTPGLELYAVVSGDPEKREAICGQLNCRVYSTFREALDDPSVDVITLATPNCAHADMAVEALSAGKHVLTDKVMCLTTAECDRMIQAAEANGRFLTVLQNRRCDGDFRTLMDLIGNGHLGDVKWIEMSWQGFGIWGRWRGEAAMGGGKIYDLGPHMIDQILKLIPDPVNAVFCRTHHDFPEADVESEGLIVISFASGKTAVVDVSSLATVSKPRFYVRGTGGTFLKTGLDPQEKAMMAGNIDVAVEDPETYGILKRPDTIEERIPTVPGRWRDLFENLRDVLTVGASPMIPLQESRRLMVVIEAAKQSATSGQVVPLPDI